MHRGPAHPAGYQGASASDPAGEELVIVKAQPFNAEAPLECLKADVTPVSSFYVRNHFPVPHLDPATYRLSIGGAVEQPLELSLEDLRALGIRTFMATLECAGNQRTGLAPLPVGEPWDLGAVSTATWSGVPLRAVLERAGLRPGVVEILAVGADRGRPSDWPEEIPFARALPLEKALHPDTLLALEMNGEPLAPHHGAPLRLVVPDWYGMASVKWLQRLEALTEPFRGYYQTQRYIYIHTDATEPVPVTTIQVRALITSPVHGQTLAPGKVIVRGKAWSGAAEVVKVEVAIDGGENWQEARLLPALWPHAWRSWEFEWDASEPGRHVLRARATDAHGNTQPDVPRWNRYGYGNNAIRPVIVTVR